MTETPPFTVHVITGIYQPCWIACAVCGVPLPETAAEVRVVLADTPHAPIDTLRTETVCSEGCAIRFVTAGAPPEMTWLNHPVLTAAGGD